MRKSREAAAGNRRAWRYHAYRKLGADAPTPERDLVVFAGAWMAIVYAFAALIMFILIIAIPLGVAALRIGFFALWLFGRPWVLLTVYELATAALGVTVDSMPTPGRSPCSTPG